MKMMNWGGILIPLPMDLKNHVHIDSCPSLKSPSTLKKCILRQKENYGNSNISPCKKHNFQNIILHRSLCKNKPIII
jgi:hypothetical protein